MCGIAGIMCLDENYYNYDENRDLIQNMTRSLAHRGPDGEGIEELDYGKVMFGHRRLAIIDLSENARQPMKSSDGRYCITYNGEIYNYKELRRDLISSGYKFVSESDTEVVLNIFAEYGNEGIKLLNGMFAFAIWDDYKKQLVLARDRYGSKPLYYSYVNNCLLFSSEYKAIILNDEFKREIDLETLKEYLTFQNILSSKTFFKNISILEPGSYMVIGARNDKSHSIVKYWDYSFDESLKKLSYEECKEELDRLFVQAVRRQLVSDVEVGSYLSGGVDSGSIVAVASGMIPKIKTFTCGFDLYSASESEISTDERLKAEQIALSCNTEHYEMVIKASDMERCLNDLVWHLEDPRVGHSSSNYYASKFSSDFVKVVLSGSGGDELFAGYPWRYYRVINCQSALDYIDTYFTYWQRMLSQDELKDFLAPVYMKIKDYSVKEVFKEKLLHTADNCMTREQFINYSLYFEAKNFLHGLLIVDDKLSMAHGLETRTPFLDNDLVDFAMKIPVEYKLARISDKSSTISEMALGLKKSDAYDINKDGKIILRDVMKKYVPADVAKRRKQGFSAPDAGWFKHESLGYIKSILLNSNSKIYNFLDRKKVQSSLNDHISGTKNNRMLIWSLLNIEIWLSEYM